MKKIYETVNIDDLTPYDNNPRNNDAAVDAVAESIRQCGYIAPIVVDEDGVILAGHTRYKALRALEREQVDIIIVQGLNDDQKRKYRLLDNKTNELAGWDFEALEAELDGLDFDGFDFGFDLGDVDDEIEVTEDEAPAEPAEPRCKVGDLWKLGNHRLICGDSTDAAVIDRLMDGARADMVLSDPPYGMKLNTDFSTIKGSLKSIGRKQHTRGNKYEKVIGDNEDFTPDLIETVFNNFGDCKEVFLFGADYFAEILPDKNDGSWLVWDKRKESQADAIGAEFELIWSKTKHKRRMLRHDWFGFLSSENSEDARNRVHPTQKPVTLLCDIINQWGQNAKTIIDLYGGSGSTMIACEQLGRNCYMAELSPEYCDIIIERWEAFTGQKAERIA